MFLAILVWSDLRVNHVAQNPPHTQTQAGLNGKRLQGLNIDNGNAGLSSTTFPAVPMKGGPFYYHLHLNGMQMFLWATFTHYPYPLDHSHLQPWVVRRLVLEYPVFVYPWLYISTDIQAGLDVEMGIASLGNPQFLSARATDLEICAVEELPRWNWAWSWFNAGNCWRFYPGPRFNLTGQASKVFGRAYRKVFDGHTRPFWKRNPNQLRRVDGWKEREMFLCQSVRPSCLIQTLPC